MTSTDGNYSVVPTGAETVLGDIELADSRGRTLTFTPKVPPNAPTVLTFNNVNVTSKYKKRIIVDASGSITGGFWAIMGSSGSGKTTLLSTLSLRLDKTHMDIQGDMSLNGKPYTSQMLKSMSSYVMQDDLVHAELTVGEALSYAAHLRLPSTYTKQQREERQQELLKIMGIEHCKNVIVGNTIRKGISGGERKRLCVAMELLARPQLLFLDEPTSGLDSSTSLAICHCLKQLTQIGECTVVCTIHQPQQRIFELFDNLILMKRGVVAYIGGAAKSLRYFESLGNPCPPGENPADHILTQISPTKEELESSVHGGEEQFIVPIDLTLGMDKPEFHASSGVSWLTQFSVLCHRNLKQYFRNYNIILMSLTVTIILAIFISQGIWHDIGTTQDSMLTRAPSLFFACVTQGIVASLQAVNSFPGERALVLRERASGSYCVSAYFAAKTLIDILTQVWNPIIFTCIVYPEIGYQPVANKFFTYMLFMILDTMAATSVATAVSCICVTVEMTTVVLAGIFEMCRLYGGFFTSPAQLLEFPDWKFADALSYIKYAFVGIAINEFTGLELSCPSSGSCISTGEEVMELKGYDEYTISFCAGILVAYIIGCRVIAFIALRFMKH